MLYMRPIICELHSIYGEMLHYIRIEVVRGLGLKIVWKKGNANRWLTGRERSGEGNVGKGVTAGQEEAAASVMT